MKEIDAKSILSRTKDGWFGMDYTMNLYRGCCHGCIYCDSRSDCYRVEDFDRVAVKGNAIELLAGELAGRRRKGVIGTGAMSDPYNPFEKEQQVTRQALELIGHYGFGVGLATKSDLILRDVDLLAEIARYRPVIAKMTVTTADQALAGKIEPGAPPPSRRFAAVQGLNLAGVFAGILMMPVLPFLEDGEENVLAVVERAHQSGAKFIYPMMGMTLRDGQREHYYRALDRLFPGLRREYIHKYGGRYQCMSAKNQKLYRIFSQKCEKYGILYKMKDIIAAYKGAADQQLQLF